MAALTDAAGDANGKKGGKKGKGGTTVQGDKEKSDIFKLVSASIVRFSELSGCNKSCSVSFQWERQARRLPWGQSIMVPLNRLEASEPIES